MLRLQIGVVGLLFMSLGWVGCVLPRHTDGARVSAAVPVVEEDWPVYELEAEEFWWLNLPEGRRFDASGLLWTGAGELLTVSDRGATLYQVGFIEEREAELELVPGIFTKEQLAPFAAEKTGHYDAEGLAQDESGRIYLCEEANRWILRYDPRMKRVERLEIDWSPVQHYFHPTDRNASFEGIAVGNGRLYVANERQFGRIIVVDVETLEVIDDFLVRPKGNQARDVIYSGLSWRDGFLYVLLRQQQKVLKVAPGTGRVLAEYSYGKMEGRREVAYRTWLPIGLMEGIAVTEDSIWLVADNNGLGRVLDSGDRRPVLFRCRRPDRESFSEKTR
jgi:uncharacterized protein YjiK